MGWLTVPDKEQLFPHRFPNAFNNTSIVLLALIRGQTRRGDTKKSPKMGSEKKREQEKVGGCVKEDIFLEKIEACGNLGGLEDGVVIVEERSSKGKQWKALFLKPISFAILWIQPLPTFSFSLQFTYLKRVSPIFPYHLYIDDPFLYHLFHQCIASLLFSLCCILSKQLRYFACHSIFVSHFPSSPTEKEAKHGIERRKQRRKAKQRGKLMLRFAVINMGTGCSQQNTLRCCQWHLISKEHTMVHHLCWMATGVFHNPKRKHRNSLGSSFFSHHACPMAIKNFILAFGVKKGQVWILIFVTILSLHRWAHNKMTWPAVIYLTETM